MKRYWFLLISILAVLVISCGSPYVEGAKVYIQQKEWARAKEQLNQELSINPVNGDAYYLLGQVYAEMDSLQEMAVAFEKALEYKPELAPEIKRWRESKWAQAFNRGINAGKKGDIEEALKWTETAIFIDSTNADGYKNLGYFYSQSDQDQKAKEAYGKAYKRDDTDVETGLVYVSYMMGDDEYEKALDVLTYLRSKDSMNTDILIQIGIIHSNNKDWEKALSAFEKAAELSPDDLELLFEIGRIYIISEMPDKAIENFKMVVEKSTVQDELYKNALLGWGGALKEMEKYEEAIEKFKAVIEVDGDYRNAWEHLGLSYGKMGKTREGTVAFFHSKGLGFMENGEWEEARKAFEDVLEVNPTHLPTWEKIKTVYDQLGDKTNLENAEKKIQELME
ncbi:tetratricopeptide repeat protein [bacterium]|nr:tetratricopeptide repeat protein [bacterium]